MFVIRRWWKSKPVYLLWYKLHVATARFLSYFLSHSDDRKHLDTLCFFVYWTKVRVRVDCRQTASSFELWAVANFTFHSNPVLRLCVPWESDRNKSRLLLLSFVNFTDSLPTHIIARHPLPLWQIVVDRCLTLWRKIKIVFSNVHFYSFIITFILHVVCYISLFKGCSCKKRINMMSPVSTSRFPTDFPLIFNPDFVKSSSISCFTPARLFKFPIFIPATDISSNRGQDHGGNE